MVRLRAALCLALSLGLGLMAPALLPAEWSQAHAKKNRQKIKVERSNRAAPAQKNEPRSGTKPAEPVAATAVTSAPSTLAVIWPSTVTLSTDRSSYNAGDLMTIAVMTDAACDLTLISIDSDGFAVVLFPNEYEPNNLMSAGVPKTIPRIDAAYQLRTKKPGTETLLGICAPPGSRPRGIVADYERYRFTLLGEWTDYTATIPQREIDIVKTAADERRKRRRRAPPLAPLLPPSDPSHQGRSILLVQVNEAQAQQ